jgi:uncharacterized membrane protein
MMVVALPEGKTGKKDTSAMPVRDMYPDLLVSAVWLAACMAIIYLPDLNTTPIRVIFALPVVMFIPGYCFIAALFPKENDITLIERFVLSIGLTIIVVPMISLGLNFTPWGMRLDPIAAAITFFTFVMILVAFYRRSLLPVKERFRMPSTGNAARIRQELLPAGEGRAGRFLSVVLAFLLLASILTVIYVVTVPLAGEQYTEFFILGQNRTGTSYPDRIVPGQEYLMYVGIGNHEYVTSTYTIETWMVQTEFDNTTNTSRIVAMDPNERLSLTLNHNETRIIPFNLTVSNAGYNLVEFLLFRDEAPEFNVAGMDRINQSYRDLHLWITYEEG